jgi:hypothetical protein
MSRLDVETPLRRNRNVSLRFYRIALAVSLLINVLLATGIWYYSSIEGVLSMVEMAVGILN